MTPIDMSNDSQGRVVHLLPDVGEKGQGSI